MKFKAELEYVSGYLRAGQLVGELSEQDYADWLKLSPQEQSTYLWDVGALQITSYRVEDNGPITNISWTPQPAFTNFDDPLNYWRKPK